MAQVRFQTQEFQEDGSFQNTVYQFKGNEQDGWEIIRNGERHLQLGPGYVLVRTICCGVCSTDLSRRFLPFPLPQIIGHEVVCVVNEKPVVVEINASHKARGRHVGNCAYCSNGMDSHCPERLTLGINRLPGGFSPYLLAPLQAVHAIPNGMQVLTASFTEPFAAALQGVDATSPEDSDAVAVLGPRRLGMLVIAALSCVRKEAGRHFKIIGIVRYSKLVEQCKALGADEVINLEEMPAEDLKQSFDVVYDTTGTSEGFASALQFSRRVVHLKSTHGQVVMGLKHLTELVVDEIALLPFDKKHLLYSWPMEKQGRKKRNILVSPKVSEEILSEARSFHPDAIYHRMGLMEAGDKILRNPNYLSGSSFPRFDLAIVSELEEVDPIIRPVSEEDKALIRARGAILLAASDKAVHESALAQAMRTRKIEIHSSRCGDFKRALKLLQENPQIAQCFEETLITHKFPLEKIEEAFQVASDSERSVKVIVEAPAI